MLKGAYLRGFLAVFAAFFSATIRKIIIAFAVLFAALLSNISANAQQAEMRVFEQASGAITFYDASNLNQSLPTLFINMISNVGANIPENRIFVAGQFSLLSDNGMTKTMLNGANANDIPTLDNVPLEAGDGICICEDHPNPGFMITLRIYSDGTNLHLADDSYDLTMQTLAATVSVNQFFIRSDTGESTTTPHTLNIGYVAPTCTGTTPELTDNGLGCRATEREDCTATAPYFDSTVPECRLPTDDDGNGDMECASINSGAEPIFDATQPGNCRAAAGMNECPSARPIFDPSLTATDKCRLPTDADDNGDAECASVYDAMPKFDVSESDRCRAFALADCIGGQTLNENVPGNMCEDPVCEATHIFNNAEDAKTCDPRTFAACNADTPVFSPASADPADGGICISAEAFLNGENISAADSYTAAKCGQAGWMVGYSVQTDTRENAAEICGIPVARQDNLATAAALESQPQIADGDMAGGCIMRMSAGFDVANSTPDISNAVRCDDDNLFGKDGEFPQMPEGFAAGDRLTIAVVADGRNRIFFGDAEIRAVAISAPQNDNDAEVAIFGAVGLGMAAFAIADFLYDGRPADVFAFSPDFGYSINESGYFVRAGGKIEYAASENLRMHWSAAQTNTGGEFGDFRYLSEAKYTADFWTAAFSESVAGKTADYNLSLSANLQNGIWKISPVYRMHSEWKESDYGIETETQNELNLEGEFRYNRWIINPSAGFGWQNFGEFANNGKFQINAIHRF